MLNVHRVMPYLPLYILPLVYLLTPLLDLSLYTYPSTHYDTALHPRFDTNSATNYRFVYRDRIPTDVCVSEAPYIAELRSKTHVLNG